MLPVEAVRTSTAEIPSADAAAPAIARSSSAPAGPVMALALPLLATMARTDPVGTRPDAYATGAAHSLFAVKTPAVDAGTSETISARSRRSGFRPAFTPAYLNPCGNFIAFSFSFRIRHVSLRTHRWGFKACFRTRRGPGSGPALASDWRSGAPDRRPP